MSRGAALSLVIALLFPVSAPAQAHREPGAALTVYLMTFGPGRAVWERFGHNAIWIHDPVNGSDQAYNYGLFDFRQENFILRFARGQMRLRSRSGSDELQIEFQNENLIARCDGQILVLHDLLGFNPDFRPKFARHFLAGTDGVLGAIAGFDQAVKSGAFPAPQESYS